MGMARSTIFWLEAFPIYLSYRFTQFRVRNDPENVQDAAFLELHERYAPRALEIILKLRGFYTKFGQVGASRHDIMPRQYTSRLESLLDNCPVEDFAVIRSVIERELGQPLEAVFASFERVPLGSASIGQVHKAVLHDGRVVAVKVQYPGVEKLFRSDIATCRSFCKLAQPVYLPMFDEIEKQFMTEFDYAREADNLALVRANLAASPYSALVAVPEPVLELCTRSVLVMEFLPAVKLADALRANLELVAKHKGVTAAALREQIMRDRDAMRTPSATRMSLIHAYIRLTDALHNLAVMPYNVTLGLIFGFISFRSTPLPLNLAAIMDLLVKVHGYEVLVNGAFNGDPHPGNILMLPDGRLGLIDYGQVKRLSEDDRLQLARLIVALARDDKAAVVHLMAEAGFKTKRMDPHVLERIAVLFYDRDSKDVIGNLNVQTYLESLEARDPIVAMADQFIMAGRLAMLMRGMGTMLAYPISIAQAWRPIAEQVIREAEQAARKRASAAPAQ